MVNLTVLVVTTMQEVARHGETLCSAQQSAAPSYRRSQSSRYFSLGCMVLTLQLTDYIFMKLAVLLRVDLPFNQELIAPLSHFPCPEINYYIIHSLARLLAYSNKQ